MGEGRRRTSAHAQEPPASDDDPICLHHRRGMLDRTHWQNCPLPRRSRQVPCALGSAVAARWCCQTILNAGSNNCRKSKRTMIRQGAHRFSRPASTIQDFMEPVALSLLGDPNTRLSRPPRDVRFGNDGSVSVNFEDGTWFDHENQIGGGVLDLIKHKTGHDHGDAKEWLRREGICPPAPSQCTPESFP